MYKVVLYSFLLILGIIASQTINFQPYHEILETATVICLAYIMLEVGLEFTIDKKNLGSYGKDYFIAATAAAFPWIFCAAYFYFILGSDLKEALLVGRFAAPTSAGILFAMLSAAGLGVTWLFNKARILAIFDDLDTILLMIPLQMMYIGFNKESLFLIILIILILFLAYRHLHEWYLPTGRLWLIFYSCIVVMVCELIEHSTDVPLEVLLPAFALGCIIFNPHDPYKPMKHFHEHAFIEPETSTSRNIDASIKYLFMFLVGCSLPKINIQPGEIDNIILHVIFLTILSNIGKMFPTFCYRNEASFNERLALSVAMFPRGGSGSWSPTCRFGLWLERGGCDNWSTKPSIESSSNGFLYYDCNLAYFR